jgi:hypothetical protein
MQSLLGQFYSRIKGSQENIASDGLTYILQHSKSARLAINKIIKSDCGLDLEDLTFSTQNSGDKLERPDISGHDTKGKEVLILEAKFWSALTDNQPIEYLKRLKQNSALVFICPTLRIRPVFDELIKRVKTTQVNFTPNHEIHSILFDANKYLMVKTWNEILGTIKLHLVQNNEQSLISDIDQIIGFCNTIDSNAFLPLQSDDLSPKYAKRINSYYDLIDKLVDELRKREFADTIGLKMTPQRCGYTRYLKTNKFGISLNLKFDFWSQIADTPFWLSIKHITPEKDWVTTSELRNTCKQISWQLGFTIYETNNEEIFFALFPSINKTEDIVINDLTDQIIKLITNLDRNIDCG